MRYSREYIENMMREIPETAFRLFVQKGIANVTMQNIADAAHYAVASLYRHYGTKRSLVIQIAVQQWTLVAQESEQAYAEAGGPGFTACQELEFYLSSYVYLYREKKDLLKFNSDFDQYILLEEPEEEEIKPYMNMLSCFTRSFHERYAKAYEDHSIRTDIPEQQVYFGMMYTMMSAAARFAYGTVYPFEGADFVAALEMQKDAYLHYMTPKTN